MTSHDQREAPSPENDADQHGLVDAENDRRATGREGFEFHPPGPQPTAFGAATVGGAVAASALASGEPSDEPDPREERTVRPGDGVVENAETVEIPTEKRAG